MNVWQNKGVSKEMNYKSAPKMVNLQSGQSQAGHVN